ncbi:DNA-packaging protein [Allosphingosinicella indica]|uniref:Large terminase phage packaging protein n=1 Tax=Allosphingosinicella indica TaxID=941907 RepID=A0A1X7GEJ5_9SPHN|nr:terminase family protein [Allosphingosinicella indica]SMF68126.1 Large terminase phage packaging protein [Allosphingosinicella indica]
MHGLDVGRVRALLGALDEGGWRDFLGGMTASDLLRMDAWFELWADRRQLPRDAEGWRTWLMIAGRGFGKTRAGAEWVHGMATARTGCRIALIGASAAEVRSVMIEGPAGLLNVARWRGARVPRWEPSLGKLSWPNGSVAYVYSGEHPDGLRGPEHHFAWCDELAKWARAEETWHNLQMGLRAGHRPRAMVTTTPRPLKLLDAIAAAPRSVKTRGSTDENVSLDEDFVAMMRATYGGTRLGRQELDGEILSEAEGSLWPRDLIERSRAPAPAALARVVVAVDPPASARGDACGIVVAGLARSGTGYVLADASVGGLRPDGWARAVEAAAEAWGASRVIAEANMGGDMVESVLRSAGVTLPVRAVHARRGKSVRAEPVAALFERGLAKLAGAFPALEDEMAGMTFGGDYEGPGRSPDRADAMVWALTDLMLGRKAEPRVWVA